MLGFVIAFSRNIPPAENYQVSVWGLHDATGVDQEPAPIGYPDSGHGVALAGTTVWDKKVWIAQVARTVAKHITGRPQHRTCRQR